MPECLICKTEQKVNIKCNICGYDTCIACYNVITTKYKLAPCRYCASPEQQKAYDDIEAPILAGDTVQVMNSRTGEIVIVTAQETMYAGNWVTNQGTNFTYRDNMEVADVFGILLGRVLGKVKERDLSVESRINETAKSLIKEWEDKYL